VKYTKNNYNQHMICAAWIIICICPKRTPNKRSRNFICTHKPPTRCCLTCWACPKFLPLGGQPTGCVISISSGGYTTCQVPPRWKAPEIAGEPVSTESGSWKISVASREERGGELAALRRFLGSVRSARGGDNITKAGG